MTALDENAHQMLLLLTNVLLVSCLPVLSIAAAHLARRAREAREEATAIRKAARQDVHRIRNHALRDEERAAQVQSRRDHRQNRLRALAADLRRLKARHDRICAQLEAWMHKAETDIRKELAPQVSRAASNLAQAVVDGGGAA